MSLPLSRFKVLDLTRVRSGPAAVRILADWGADVIQIEAPGEPDSGFGSRESSDYQNLHRNKRAITLNLKKAQGREIFLKLVAEADVVVENYRPDVKFRLGIDYDSLRAVNPRIVLASISGFGQDGPYANRPGFDQIAQGIGGLMAITGMPGQGPMRAGTAIADIGAGLHCALGILIALLEREASGQGQWVSTSLLQSMIAICDFQAARWTVDGEVPEQAGNNHPTAMPMGVFSCRDGNINIAATGNRMFGLLCDVLGAPELVSDPRFSTDAARHANRDDLVELLATRIRTFDRAELIEALNAKGVAAGPIYRMNEVFDDPQVRHLGMAAPVSLPRFGDVALVGPAIELSRATFSVRDPAPEQGSQTDHVLRKLGIDDAEIGALRDQGVI